MKKSLWYRGAEKTVCAYIRTANCLSSQSAAALPWLTQRVEHFDVFQVLYSVSTYDIRIRNNK